MWCAGKCCRRISAFHRRAFHSKFIMIYRGVPHETVSFCHWLKHIRVQNLVFNSTILECTLGLGLNHIRLQHFYMIWHVRCCSLMWFNPRESVTLPWGWTQILHSYVFQPMTKWYSLMWHPLYGACCMRHTWYHSFVTAIIMNTLQTLKILSPR